MLPRPRTICLLFLVLFVFQGCSSEDAPTTPPPDQNEAETLPLLPSGSFASMIIGFEALPPSIQGVADAKWSEALSRGMRVGRIQLDWADVEPAKEQFDRDVLRDHLEKLRDDGLLPLVSLYAMDSEGMTLPPDLQDRFESGTPIDHADILARYRAVLDWAVPMIVEYGGWGLLVGNEVDGYLIDNPSQVRAVASFYRNARTHTRTISPELAVSATHTTDGPIGNEPHYASLISELDFASINYYPLDRELRVVDFSAASVTRDIDLMLAAAAGKQLVLQELGCPAGYESNSLMGSDLETQRKFFEYAFAELAEEPKFRAAFVFQMVDWSEGLFDRVYADAFDDEIVPEGFVERFREWLVTTGCVSYIDGTVRPAWDVFLDALDS